LVFFPADAAAGDVGTILLGGEQGFFKVGKTLRKLP
jgi:hypothetical protein